MLKLGKPWSRWLLAQPPQKGLQDEKLNFQAVIKSAARATSPKDLKEERLARPWPGLGTSPVLPNPSVEAALAADLITA